MIAGLAFDDANLQRFVAVVFDSPISNVVGTVTLGIPNNTMDRRREIGDVRVDHHYSYAIVDSLFNQRGGSKFVVCAKDNRIYLLCQNVLNHAHLTVDIST